MLFLLWQAVHDLHVHGLHELVHLCLSLDKGAGVKLGLQTAGSSSGRRTAVGAGLSIATRLQMIGRPRHEACERA